MKRIETDNAARFPVDLSTVTGVRIEGTEGVTPVDSGTAALVTAGGETWLHWDNRGLQHAVSFRHIIEVVSAPAEDSQVIDLTAEKGEFAHQMDAG